jgi:hypothetical protein
MKDKKFNSVPKKYRPVSAWGYLGYSILYAIPVIGWIFLLVFAFHPGNLNRRSYARFIWLCILLTIVIAFVTGTILYNAFPEAKSFIDGFIYAMKTGTTPDFHSHAPDGNRCPPSRPSPP